MYLVVEGPDGLGKSALVKLLAEAAKERGIPLYPEGSGITIPEPSKRFGKFQNAIGWGFDFLRRTQKDTRGKLAILDRFPIPSELVYSSKFLTTHILNGWRRQIQDLTFWPVHFVYVALSSGTFNQSGATREFLSRTLANDPYYQPFGVVWDVEYVRILHRYAKWWELNQSHALRLEWIPGNYWWSEETANQILDWLQSSTEALNV